MITEIKTKKEVIIDAINNVKGTVYIVVKNLVFNEEKFSAVVIYETREYDNEGEFVGSKTIHMVESEFTHQEADHLEKILGVSGNTVSERLIDLVKKATMYEVSALGLFGLKPADFEQL